MKPVPLLSILLIVLAFVLSPLCEVHAQLLFYASVDYGVDDRPWSVAIGDFDGDGHEDLAVANTSSENASILMGNGDGTFADILLIS